MTSEMTTSPTCANVTMQCSSHGELLDNGTCRCEEGWSGDFCEEGNAFCYVKLSM